MYTFWRMYYSYAQNLDRWAVKILIWDTLYKKLYFLSIKTFTTSFFVYALYPVYKFPSTSVCFGQDPIIVKNWIFVDFGCSKNVPLVGAHDKWDLYPM
jgi:hypothetical protein